MFECAVFCWWESKKCGTVAVWFVSLHMIYECVILLFLRLHAWVYCSPQFIHREGARNCFGKYGVRLWPTVYTACFQLQHMVGARDHSKLCVWHFLRPGLLGIQGASKSNIFFGTTRLLVYNLAEPDGCFFLHFFFLLIRENDVHLPVLFLLWPLGLSRVFNSLITAWQRRCTARRGVRPRRESESNAWSVLAAQCTWQQKKSSAKSKVS